MLSSPLFPFLPMHIPDGFLSVVVSLVFWVVSIAFISVALRKTSLELGEREVPVMGVLAAAIFAGQMLNFTIAGGTSGHLLGAALAVILLGPWPAVLVMTSVVSVQAILFQDGGILALGTNIFNMAVVGVLVSHTVFTLLKRLLKTHPRGIITAGFCAAWFSIFLTSIACALELALSGTSPSNIAVPAMAAIHALIGLGEGLITAGALAFLAAARRDLIQRDQSQTVSGHSILIGGGLIALILAILAPLASSHPDGLEWVAEQNHFGAAAREALFNLIPDYAMPGISNPALATIAAAILGVVIVFSVAYGLARAEKRAAVKETTEG